MRAALTGIPIAFGVYLLAVAESTLFGLLAIAASQIVLLLVLAVERILIRIGRAFDSATDPMIAKSGGRRLKAAIEEGRVEVLHGPVKGELRGGYLLARAGGSTVTISSVQTAWQARASSHLVLAENPPGARSDFGKILVLPASGDIATAIAESSGCFDCCRASHPSPPSQGSISSAPKAVSALPAP